MHWDEGMEAKEPTCESDQKQRQVYRVRLPGFIHEEEVALGDVIKRVTYAVGLKPCGGCERRAAALNRWMVFTR